LLLFGLLIFICSKGMAQQPDSLKRRPAQPVQTDTAKNGYVNPGKLAGRRAVYGSLILPGLGQLRNALDKKAPNRSSRVRSNIYRGAKIAGIYTAFTMLTLSYKSNNENYHFFLDELVYRRENGEPRPNAYAQSSDDQILQAKDIYRRNKEVIIVSYFGVYLIGAIDAYVDARLNYFNVDDDLSIRFSPTMINTAEQYGFNSYPGLKFSLKF
jgi:hypothetical protein